MNYAIRIKLLSDSTFGRGDGVAGLVDQEVEHDSATGLPLIRGRTLKGLLVEECANILYALGNPADLCEVARKLFGVPGSTQSTQAIMHLGQARLPDDLCKAVEADIKPKRLSPADVLDSLTDIRRQTAVDSKTDAPDKGSLRSMRVVIRETTFIAEIHFTNEPDDNTLALLSACVMALRRGGIGRNRGQGKLQARLFRDEQDVTEQCFDQFRKVFAQKPGGS